MVLLPISITAARSISFRTAGDFDAGRERSSPRGGLESKFGRVLGRASAGPRLAGDGGRRRRPGAAGDYMWPCSTARIRFLFASMSIWMVFAMSCSIFIIAFSLAVIGILLIESISIIICERVLAA